MLVTSQLFQFVLHNMMFTNKGINHKLRRTEVLDPWMLFRLKDNNLVASCCSHCDIVKPRRHLTTRVWEVVEMLILLVVVPPLLVSPCFNYYFGAEEITVICFYLNSVFLTIWFHCSVKPFIFSINLMQTWEIANFLSLVCIC